MTPTTNTVFPAGTHFGLLLEGAISTAAEEVAKKVRATLIQQRDSPGKHGEVHGEVHGHVEAAVDSVVLAYLQHKASSEEKWRFGVDTYVVDSNARHVFTAYMEDVVTSFFRDHYESGMTAEDLLSRYVTNGKFGERAYRYSDLFEEAARKAASSGRFGDMLRKEG